MGNIENSPIHSSRHRKVKTSREYHNSVRHRRPRDAERERDKKTKREEEGKQQNEAAQKKSSKLTGSESVMDNMTHNE